jgi:hypothetical protein
MFSQVLSANARAAVKAKLSGHEVDSSKQRKQV